MGVSGTYSPTAARAGLFWRDRCPDQGGLGEHRGRKDTITPQVVQRPFDPAVDGVGLPRKEHRIIESF